MSLIKNYLLTQMNNELFDPGIDNLPMPVDGIEPDLEMLTQREQLMEDIDAIIESYQSDENFDINDCDDRDDLISVLCDAVIKNFPTK